MPEKPAALELSLFHAEVCQALADTTRITILYELGDSARCVSELVEALDQPQPTVSRHLKTLRDRGMVHAERQGAQVVYSLVDRRVIDALDLLRAVMGEIITNRSRLAQALAVEGRQS